MSDKAIWQQLAEPFPAEVVKSRQGPKQHADACTKQYGQCTQKHMMLSYVDARDVAERLDAVVLPIGWQFEASAVPGTNVVHGRLGIHDQGSGWAYREDHGYPNSDSDEEPLKSATSDALKRCAVLFGIGRHLYDDNHTSRPQTTHKPATATRTPVPSAKASAPPDEPPWPAETLVPVAQEIFGADAIDESKCPVHGKAWRTNARGYYCSTKVGNGWCDKQPSKAWQAHMETAA